MTAIHQYISAIGSFQGLLLFFLLVCDRNTTAASKVLGIYCLSMGLAFFLPFITFGIASDVFNPLAAWLFFLPVMYGVLLYLYCSKVVLNAQFSTADLFHMLPLLACLALNYDVLLYDHEAFRLWIVGSAAPTKRLWLSEYLLFVVAIAYLIATAFLIRRYHQQASDNLSNFNPKIFLWLSILVSSFLIIFVVKGVMAFTNFATMGMLVLSDALIVFIILLIALTQWKNPTFFMIESLAGNRQSRIENASKRNEKSTGAIEDDTRAVMFDELKEHLEQQKSYRDSELSLAKLADSIGLSSHHLSEVLNQHAGQNFNRFINTYRVKEVCDKLNSDSSLKVLDLAMEAGFSSKSTFNTTFKKIKGVTPTQYRQKVH